MKKILLSLALLTGCSKISNDVNVSAKMPVYVPYFVNGQILLPDYVCPDTLIVVNSIDLNKGMALVEQGFIDATDYQLDSILHTNCITKP